MGNILRFPENKKRNFFQLIFLLDGVGKFLGFQFSLKTHLDEGTENKNIGTHTHT